MLLLVVPKLLASYSMGKRFYIARCMLVDNWCWPIICCLRQTHRSNRAQRHILILYIEETSQPLAYFRCRCIVLIVYTSPNINGIYISSSISSKHEGGTGHAGSRLFISAKSAHLMTSRYCFVILKTAISGI